MTLLLSFALGVLATLLGLVLVQRVAGFPSQKVRDHRALQPAFDLPTRLSGPMDCTGTIFGPLGRVSSRFKARMHTSWNGPNGIMDENFTYDDGSTQTRQWRLTIGQDGSLRAEADDVPEAGHGQLAGNALRLTYQIRLPKENGGHVLDAVDWMYLQQDGTILNRSQFRKYGIMVAELFCVMRPEEDEDA
ncbi:DUF3833 domain-containing protein [Jannaschia sp. S6380]|uniref:DUF3833 family protein n=1 Tax=Jannaschia sp. S6380 TaxID=2926408 RepID=UPI001FF56809|nr:DUF3833 family protein [Jannaschia sp. S6380]MCK0168999.1 DUF3833 domain-containing protein [Jannaschia sp. S6380]